MRREDVDGAEDYCVSALAEWAGAPFIEGMMIRFVSIALAAVAAVLAVTDSAEARRRGIPPNAHCKANNGMQMADTSLILTDRFLKKMKSTGVQTVARYYEYEDETQRGKRLRKSELRLIAGHGFNLLVVFQHKSGKPGTFLNWRKRGPADARRALAMAKEMNQPKGSGIYFAVDNDLVGHSPWLRYYNKAVLSYFREIDRVFAKSGKTYNIGVYGSGATCKLLRQHKLVSYCWLSFAKKHQGTQQAIRSKLYHLRQMPEGMCGGREVDFNRANPAFADYGQFKVRLPAGQEPEVVAARAQQVKAEQEDLEQLLEPFRQTAPRLPDAASPE
jgi:hypothetical protein